jgi:hypothetical protein
VTLQSVEAAHDEEQPSEAASSTLSILSPDFISAELQKLDSDTSISAVSKQTITEFYQSALKQLQAASIFDATALSYQQQIDDGDLTAKKIDRQKDKLLSHVYKPDVSLSDTSAITRLEQQLKVDNNRLLILESGLNVLNQQLQQHIVSPRQIHLTQQILADKLIEI